MSANIKELLPLYRILYVNNLGFAQENHLFRKLHRLRSEELGTIYGLHRCLISRSKNLHIYQNVFGHLFEKPSQYSSKPRSRNNMSASTEAKAAGV